MTFVSVAETLIKDAEVAVKLGARSDSLPRDYKQRLDCYCRPFFSKTAVMDVNHRKLKAFQAWLLDEREVSGSTIRTIMSFVSCVLKLAANEGHISSVPLVPRPAQKDAPRPSFTRAEYKKLLMHMKRIERTSPPLMVRAWPIDWELRAFATFMVNSFLRPKDAFALRHRHVEVKSTPEGVGYLKLTPPSSKTNHHPVVTMPAAVYIYNRLKKRHAERGKAAPDDFVFLPDRKCRPFAVEIIRRQFNRALAEAELTTTPLGEVRTLYSLRHTCIMFRMLNSQGLDLLTIARAARTSVEMIDRFYAAPLHAEMNVDLIHSMRRPSRLTVAAGA